MLHVKNIEKYLSGEEAFMLDNITFSIPKGYICGLIGENGAGKTTLMKIIMGLYRASGDVVIDGCDLKADEQNAKEKLGIVIDEGFFEQEMTIEQIGVFYGSLYRAFDNIKYLKFIEKFKLDKDMKYKKLSKGMKTKVQLAFSISHDAKLFLFDEPTAGLDKRFREEFLKLSAELVSDGERSVLISSHITEDLDRIADYIAYMQEGKLLFCMPKDELCEHFFMVTGEDYKINLLPKEAVVFKEKNTYSSTAMVLNKKCFAIDEALEKHTPNIREFMHYFVKGGKYRAKVIAEKYLND